MRLKSIKLAGFKSFVDPTTIPFPSQMTAIIGPNGCGKSNVIDAVRWVMGESSAKHLRGESMSDVIFNGSTARKPISQASIELIFDNSEGKLGGEYAQYNEIAIKRLITRDGLSHYFLNNTRCRRKDITDIFLGTGLGPRSYAIIEQGTISRLIEAKPDELRHFMEEAAGISKYKERRRETENRMQHTKDNLARIDDIRLELEKQLERLFKQAQTAQKYKQFKGEERKLKGELYALQWKETNFSLEQLDANIRQYALGLEEHLTIRASTDAKIIELKISLTDQQDEVNTHQSNYYEKNSQIAKLEQIIQNQKERSQQIEKDIKQTEKDFYHAQTSLKEEETTISILEDKISTLLPEIELQEEKLENIELSSEEAEGQLQAWQQKWYHFQTKASSNQKSAELEQSRIQHIENQIHRLKEKKNKLQEQQQTAPQNLYEQIALLTQEQEDKEIEVNQLQTTLSSSRSLITTLQKEKQALNNQLLLKSKDLRKQQEERIALQAHQKAQSGTDTKKQEEWLKNNQLTHIQNLSESIDVDKGWEKAIEMVLDKTLQAFCLPSFNAIEQALLTLKNSYFESLETNKTSENSTLFEKNSALNLPLLIDKVRIKNTHQSIDADILIPFIAQIYCTSSLTEAFQQRSQLKTGESLITPEGFWLGRNWLKFKHSDSNQMGVLARQNKINELTQAIESLQIEVDRFEERLSQISIEIEKNETESIHLQQTCNLKNKTLAQGNAQLSAQKARFEESEKRLNHIRQELVENEMQENEDNKILHESRQKLEDALLKMTEDADNRLELDSQQHSLREQVEMSRQQAKNAKTKHHEIQLQFKTLQTESDTRKKNIEGLKRQFSQLAIRTEELAREKEKGTPEIDLIRSQLEEIIFSQQSAEQKLIASRNILEDSQNKIMGFESKRLQAENHIEKIRHELEEKRIQRQSLQSQIENWLLQLQTVEESLEAILARLPENTDIKLASEELEKASHKISRLGAINLAAIEEYDAEKLRKDYLDQQAADLYLSLETLEKAIQKIDIETKAKFKETFDLVNKTIGELFPKVFGGGSAYLELTGQDLLDTGVTIMARPPGKKNSTIHLLSGGEKALTAIALVFSIFQLNPAPFCMLDEVDAPLDDTNVGRLSRLVSDMSSQVQFIYITHNKIAMECANQLIGVTMQEAGVSRIVSVNIDEAIEMVNN